ncbi:MAG TPA: SPOR domain-containing protein [Microvirga sp.]|jgi:hypothetical protein
MNESVKPRFAVDLDEIERQLSQAQAAPQTAAPAPRQDPLAELARIVGQEDPFQNILSAEKPARHQSDQSQGLSAAGQTRASAKDPAGLDDLFVTRAEPMDGAPPLRGSYEPAPAQGYGTYQEPQAEADYDQAYDPRYYEQGHSAGAYEPAASEYDVAPRKSRKGMIAVGAVLGAAALGLGGAFMLQGPATMLTGEPPLITASKEPSKVPPQSPGGVEIPNQNKQIYERAAQESPTKVVNREEQPVDVRQHARANAPTAEATGATTPVAGHGLGLSEPKKVRTVSIRPDGTMAGGDMAAAAPLPTPAAPAARPTVVAGPPAMTLPTAAQAQAPVPVQAPAAPQRTAATVTPSSTPAPRAVPATPATGGGASPQAAPSTTSQPAPQRVASASPTTIAPAPEAPAATGGFAVQLGVSSSESDAKATLQRLQQRYADLGDAAPMIRRAEVNGKEVYRVRFGPMARDEASALCSKIQGQGGQCFVAKN